MAESRLKKSYNWDMKNLQNLDWQALKTEYKVGTIKSVSAFLRGKGISLSGNTIRHIKGWAQERDAYQGELQKKIEEESKNKTADVIGEDVAEVRRRHVQVGRSLQAKGLEGLLMHKPRSAIEATRMFVEGAQLEREALGFDSHSRRNASHQQEGSFDPALLNTNYMKRLQKMSNEELKAEIDNLANTLAGS